MNGLTRQERAHSRVRARSPAHAHAGGLPPRRQARCARACPEGRALRPRPPAARWREQRGPQSASAAVPLTKRVARGAAQGAGGKTTRNGTRACLSATSSAMALPSGATRSRPRLRACARTRAPALTVPAAHASLRTCARACMHTRPPILARMCARTHTHTRTHARTHARMRVHCGTER